MDYFVLKCMSRSLENLIINHRIVTCGQESDQTLVIGLVNPRNPSIYNHLVFNCSGAAKGLFLLEKPSKKKSVKRPLAKSFSNKISGSRVIDIRMPFPDRAICFTLEATGWKTHRELWFELPGTGNVICCENGRILECLTKIPGHSKAEWIRMPGHPFHPGRCYQDESKLALSRHAITTVMDTDGKPISWRDLLQKIQPMTPDLAKAIIRASKSGNAENGLDLVDRLQSSTLSSEMIPGICSSGNTRSLVACREFCPTGDYLACHSVVDGANHWRVRLEAHSELLQRQLQMKKRLERIRTKIRNNIQAMQQDLERLPDPEALRRQADLLAANYHLIKPGVKQLIVQDIFSEDQCSVVIELDPKSAPQAQIKKLFHLAGKSARARPQIEERAQSLDRVMSALGIMMEEVSSAESMLILDEIDQRLETLGYAPVSPRSRNVNSVDIRRPYLKTVLDRQIEVLVGRGARENDVLTFHIAAPHDFWLHAKGYQGAHVIIRNPGKLNDPPMPVLLVAARLAVYFSKARGEKSVPVIWVRRNRIRKAKGNIPGRVVVTRHNTVSVASPSKQDILRLDLV